VTEGVDMGSIQSQGLYLSVVREQAGTSAPTLEMRKMKCREDLEAVPSWGQASPGLSAGQMAAKRGTASS
jgi:hypothetical protein